MSHRPQRLTARSLLVEAAVGSTLYLASALRADRVPTLEAMRPRIVEVEHELELMRLEPGLPAIERVRVEVLDVTPPIPLFEPGFETPSDVYRRSGVVEVQIRQLEELTGGRRGWQIDAPLGGR